MRRDFMPSTYAHYRFGSAILPTMPADARRTIQRFRRLFDVGLHGPDIFYYHSPVFKAGAAFLGIRFHEQTGQEFFQRVCRAVRLERSEAALSYLYGVLCHYCLDTTCHPYVKEQAQTGVASHAEIETEFDRYLLCKDGKVPPHTQDLSPHLQLTPGECETVAKFYPPASAANVKDSIRGMTRIIKLFSVPEGPRRTAVERGVDLVAKEFSGMLMTTTPNPKCKHLNEDLLAQYEKAMAKFPEMLSQLQAHMTYSGSFGEEFDSIFG